MKILVVGDADSLIRDEGCLNIPLGADEVDLTFMVGNFFCHAEKTMNNLHGLSSIGRKPLIFVPGYKEILTREEGVHSILHKAAYANYNGLDIRLGYCHATDIGEFRIITSTLWPDFGLSKDSEVAKDAAGMFHNHFLLPDSNGESTIIASDKENVTVHWVSRRNQECRKFISDMIGDRDPAKVIVATYSLPTPDLFKELGTSDILTSCFSNDIPDLVERAGIWIHGAADSTGVYYVRGTVMAVNSRGSSNPEFSTTFTLEV